MNDATPSPNTSSCPSLPHVQFFLAGSTPAPPHLPGSLFSKCPCLAPCKMCALLASESETLVAANLTEPSDKNSHQAGRRLHLIWVAAWVAPEDAPAPFPGLTDCRLVVTGVGGDEVIEQL